MKENKLKITEHEFRANLKAYARSIAQLMDTYLEDRPGYVRESGIERDPDFKDFGIMMSAHHTAVCTIASITVFCGDRKRNTDVEFSERVTIKYNYKKEESNA